MEISIIYQNPALEVAQRVYYAPDCPQFEVMKRTLHSEFLCNDSTTYCGFHHSVETRYSVRLHSQCEKKTYLRY